MRGGSRQALGRRVLLAIPVLVLVATDRTPAGAASIVVNSTADGSPANDGSCTLREAILNADNGNQSGSTDCLAGSGADTT